MSELRIFGLGTSVPEEVTIEALMGLEECGAVYASLADKKALAWLKKRFPKLKPAADAAAPVKSAATAVTGLAVWGHPQFSSALAREAAASARAKKIPVRIYGAVSPVGSAFARSVSFLGGDYGYQGAQGYELETLLADPTRWQARLPLVAYAEAAKPGRWDAFALLLASRLSAGHELRVYRDGKPEQRVPLGKFGGAGPEAAVILVPPAGGAPQRPHDMAA